MFTLPEANTYYITISMSILQIHFLKYNILLDRRLNPSYFPIEILFRTSLQSKNDVIF